MKTYFFLLLLFLFSSCSNIESESIDLLTPDSSDLPDDGNDEDDNNNDDNNDTNNDDGNNNTIGFTDTFEGTGSLVDYVTNNESALPAVSRADGRYRAELTNNSSNVTLHFNQEQGRIDAKLVTFPFEFIARNIGIGTLEDSQSAPTSSNNPFSFAGIQVHVEDFNSINSSHVVVGHRGSTGFTIEGKNTPNGNSAVNDIGENMVPDGRADIRVVGNEDRTLTVYWQLPNLNYQADADNWTLYRGAGNLPGSTPDYGASVYVGLITYAYGSQGVPFVGTCDAIQINGLD
ncbi:MAG: hypothetical protein AB8B59_09860 [Maribacter sp.]